MAVLCCRCFLRRRTDSSVAGRELWDLSSVWVVRAVYTDQNAPALGGILDQQGVSSTVSTVTFRVKRI
jgi:hypothetical protein